MCPDHNRCIPVPAEALDRSEGVPYLNLQLLAEALGLTIARDPADGGPSSSEVSPKMRLSARPLKSIGPACCYYPMCRLGRR